MIVRMPDDRGDRFDVQMEERMNSLNNGDIVHLSGGHNTRDLKYLSFYQ